MRNKDERIIEMDKKMDSTYNIQLNPRYILMQSKQLVRCLRANIITEIQRLTMNGSFSSAFDTFIEKNNCVVQHFSNFVCIEDPLAFLKNWEDLSSNPKLFLWTPYTKLCC